MYRGEELPLRSAQAQLAVLHAFEEREGSAKLHGDASAGFNDQRMEMLQARGTRRGAFRGEGRCRAKRRGKGISLRELSQVLTEASRARGRGLRPALGKWFDKLLDEGRPGVPSSYHVAWLRRLSPLEATYTKERWRSASDLRLGFNMDEEPNIRMDLDDRPQKSPRAYVIAADPPRSST